MTEAILIFRKDMRHLWPSVLIFVGLLLVGSLVDHTYTHVPLSAATSLVWNVSLLACWNLVIAVIHEERLVDDHQSWRTQPYTRGSLLLAKVLFILLCVNVPLLLMQTGVQTAVGIPLLQQAPALLWRQLFITTSAIMPAAALATVTRSLRQAILVVLAGAVTLFGLSYVFLYLRIPALMLSPEWTSQYWLKAAFTAFVALSLGSIVIYLQYFRRALTLARAVLIAGVALSLLANMAAPRSKQFALQHLLSARCAACGAVRVGLDSGTRRSNLLPFLERRTPRMAHAAIPIRIEGVPAGLELHIPKRPVEVWCLGRKFHAVVEGYRGQVWLAIDMDSSFFSQYAASQVDLEGAIELTLFARTASLPAPTGSRVAVPGVGVCSQALDSKGSVWLQCYTAARQAALALEFPGGGRQWVIERSAVDEPSPTSSEFAPLEKVTSQTPFANAPELSSLRLITEQPAFHIRARFHMSGIRLDAYGRRSTQRR